MPAKPKDAHKCARCLTQLSVQRAKARKRYCYRCDVAVKKERAEAAHRKRVSQQYGIRPEVYDQLYELQGGKCYICQRATGKVRRLAVDHDHKCCPTLPACGRCTRGLLCKTCNRTLGFARDDPDFFERAALYLIWPPMRDLRLNPSWSSSNVEP